MKKKLQKRKVSRKTKSVGKIQRKTVKKTKTRYKTKRINSAIRAKPYRKGSVLSIAYDGVNHEFALDLLSRSSGKKIGEFHIKGTTLMTSMGFPLLVSQS